MAAAYALSRYKVPGGETLRLIVSSPIIVPGVVVGLALLRYLVVPFQGWPFCRSPSCCWPSAFSG